MARQKLTIEEINQRLSPRGIQLVGEYTNVSTKTVFVCERNHKWEATPRSIMYGNRGCGKCHGNTKLTTQEVEEYLTSKSLTLISPYVNAREHIKVRCDHGHEWDCSLYNIKSGRHCPSCSDMWSNGGYVYVMSGITGTKIGISNNVDKRLLEIRRASEDATIQLTYSLFVADRNTALKIERNCHIPLKDYKLSLPKFCGSTEFFSVTPEQAIACLEANNV